MRVRIYIAFLLLLAACSKEFGEESLRFRTNDTDFSKGRLGYIQEHGMLELEKFHGHLCDGLVLGALAMRIGLTALFPDGLIDRTNIRVVSRSSPCLADAAVYLSGARYQYQRFFIDDSMQPLYIIQRIDNGQSYSVTLRPGIKPPSIDSMGALALAAKLSPCALDSLRALEDAFTEYLYQASPSEVFSLQELNDFTWQPVFGNEYLKTDILNKHTAVCSEHLQHEHKAD